MKKWLCVLLLCLLPMVALADEASLKDAVDFWDTTAHLRVTDGLLYMTVDGLEPFQPVAIKEGFVEAARALEAQNKLTAVPDGMAAELTALIGDSLTGGMTVRSIDVHQHEIVLLLEGQGDRLTLRIAEWNGQGYDVLDNSTFPKGTELDTIHFDDGSAFLWVPVDGGQTVGVSFLRYGDEWKVNLEASNLTWMSAWSSIVNTEQLSWRRNDGYSYGTLPEEWGDFERIDVVQLPLTLKQALLRLDRTGWAVVNNPNPNDRLHLRTEPSKNAKSLGKFYNKTPVKVIGSKGEWSQVTIGKDGLTGWMMTEYLAFGEAADKVACAFPNNVATLESDDLSLPIRFARAVPDLKAPETFNVGRDGFSEFLIGVVEDKWYILMTTDGQVGYVLQSWYGEGNG